MLHFCAIFVVFPILFYVLSYVFTLFVQIRLGKCCSAAKKFLQAAGSPHIHIISPVIDTDRNLPEHPKQIRLMQSRPQAFVRMCLKAALTAKRLICKKILAGCDRADRRETGRQVFAHLFWLQKLSN